MWAFTYSMVALSVFLFNLRKQSSSPLSRLQDIRPTLERICNISGTAGASFSVLHHGQVLYTDNLGYRDVAAKTAADSQTLYGLGSLTKSMTATAIGHLVKDGLLTWETPVKNILPDFQHKDPIITNLTTIVDLLAHRTGLTGDISLTFQGDGEALLPKDQLIRTFNNLDKVASFRSKWSYSSWNYGIAGLIIEKLSRRPLHEYLKVHVYDSFGMSSTTTRISSHRRGNIAKPYATDSKATPVPLKSAMMLEDTLFEAAAGAYSNVDDMLSYSASLLAVYQAGNDSELNTILSGYIPVRGPSFRERSYAMGWIRTELPGALGMISENRDILNDVNKLPQSGQGLPSMLCLGHQGETAGYYSNIAMFPETQSAIVVLTNSIPLMDSATTITQALFRALFDSSDSADFVPFTEELSNMTINSYSEQADVIKARRRVGTREHPLEEYIGRYMNELENFFIEIRVGSEDDALALLFQGHESQRYSLRHLKKNTFEWFLSLDEEAARGRYHIPDADYFSIDFRTVKNSVDHLVWAGYKFAKIK